MDKVTEVMAEAPVHAGVILDLDAYGEIEGNITQIIQKANSLTDVSRAVSTEIGKLKKSKPDYPIEILERELDFVINFLRLDSGLLSGRDKNTSKETTINSKIDSARMQHQIASRVLFASGSNASPRYVDSTYEVIANGYRRINLMDPKFSSQFSTCWKGAAYELAMMRTLLESGYRVFIPDFNQDQGIGLEDNATYQIDILSGVDFITISPNNVITLLDVTGRNFATGPTTRLENPRFLQLSNIRNQCLNKAIQEVMKKGKVPSTSDIFQAVLTFRSEAMSFELNNFGVTEVRDTKSRKRELQNYGHFKPHMESAVIETVQSIPSVVNKNFKTSYTTD